MSTAKEKDSSQVNIYDVSEHAGVSIATVSRVLNGSEKVSEKTREKVLSSMRELGYAPNIFARGLNLGSMRTVGILCTDVSDTFLAGCVYYAEQELRDHGYSSLLCSTGHRLEDKKKALQDLLGKHIDGLILIGSSYIEKNPEDQRYLREAARQIPIAIVNGLMDGENIYCIYGNDFQVTFDVTSLLLSRGRRHILYLYYSDSYSGQQKLNGCRAALATGGLNIDPDYFLRVPKDLDRIRAALQDFTASDDHPVDAILGAEDTFAVAALKYALECGRSIPEDLDIIGFNNSILSRCTMPELASIDNHSASLSRDAASNLIRVIEKDRSPEQKICLPCTLIPRGTVRGE